MIRNPVARHINTFNKHSVVLSKRRKLKSEATLRDAQDSVTKQDMLVIAHYLSQYAAFHEQTNKHRNEWFKEYKLVWENE